MYIVYGGTHFIELYNASIKRRPPLLKLTHIKLVTPKEIDYKIHRTNRYLQRKKSKYLHKLLLSTLGIYTYFIFTGPQHLLPPYPPSPPTPTSPTPTTTATHPSMASAAAAAAAAAATLYGSSILPSICMQNVFLHYQKLMAECQTLGLNKLSPYSPTTTATSTVLASPAKSEKFDEEPHPLDLCTTNTNKMLVNNNNKTSVKTSIWSPASSCEEENEMRESGNGNNPLVCHTCHRQFGSPTKLELHYRKVHHITHQTLASDSSSPGSKSSRKERIFKVKLLFLYGFFRQQYSYTSFIWWWHAKTFLYGQHEFQIFLLFFLFFL